MEFLEKKQNEIVDNIFGFFTSQIEESPSATLRQVESELASLYVKFGHGWTGRGVVGDTTQLATISGLELVRAECLERLKKENNI